MVKSGLISIIIPVHNTEDYLGDCIESVVNQTYENLEIIIVNDASSDNSKEIIKDWQKKDKRIKYLTTKKHNAALTRKEGVKQAEGEYICFVDSDDIISEEYVSVLYGGILSTKTEIATVKIAKFDTKKGIERSNNDTGNIEINNDLVEYFFEHYIRREGGYYIAQSINAKIINKNLFKKIDYSVLKTGVLEDNFIVPQILRNTSGQKITLIDNTMYYYRENHNSTMTSSITKMIHYGNKEITYPELFEITMDYIQENIFPDRKDIEHFIYKLKSQVYYELAQQLVAKNIRIRNLEARLVDAEAQQLKLKKELSFIRSTILWRIRELAKKIKDRTF